MDKEKDAQQASNLPVILMVIILIGVPFAMALLGCNWT